MLVQGFTQGFSVAWGKALEAERAASPSAGPGEQQEWRRIRQRNRRAEQGRPDRVQRQHRQTQAEAPAIVRSDADRIGSMLSRGFDEPTIRRKLGLSRRQWDLRMAALVANGRARITIWARVSTETRIHLQALARVRQQALDATPPAYNAAIRATLAMNAICAREVSIGQSLGVYRRVAKPHQPDRPDSGLDLDDASAFESLPHAD